MRVLALLVASLVLAPTASAVLPFTLQATGVLTHTLTRDGAIVCEARGAFRADTAPGAMALVDGGTGAIVGASACGELAHGFDRCDNGKVGPHACERAEPWTRMTLEFVGVAQLPEIAIAYERVRDDGVRERVAGIGYLSA